MPEKTKIAIIGCGAIARIGHLPAINSIPHCEVTILVDRNQENAEELAQISSESPDVTDDYKAVIGKADAAVLALPHNLHCTIASELLTSGIHVLVEKPMALTVAECNEMLAAASKGNTQLAVGLMRRFLPSVSFTRWVISSGILGPIQHFDFREGNIYNWKVASNFFFHRDSSGGGVLFDTGAHTLDLMLHWLGDVTHFDYFDDSHGGVEADCILQATLASGAKGFVQLSRTADLRNTAIIRGEYAELEVDLRSNAVDVRSLDAKYQLSGPISFEGNDPESQPQAFRDLFRPQIENFLAAIHGTEELCCPGIEAIRSIDLMEQCYNNRQQLTLPWMKERSA